METKQYSFILRFVGLLACLLIVKANAGEPIQITAKPIFAAPSEVTLKDGRKVIYNTFRIPSLSRTNNGTLIAVCEGWTKEEAGAIDLTTGQYLNNKDSRSDLVMRKSFDGGITWSPITTLMEGADPEGDNWRDMYSNATQVVDSDVLIDPSNPKPTVYLHFNKWIGGQGPGSVWALNIDGGVLDSNGNESWVMGFDDNGQVLNDVKFLPRRLYSVKEANWRVAYGPGSGIQLSSGRLLVPAARTVGYGWEVYSIYSDDHGSSWQRGFVAPSLDFDGDDHDDSGGENQLVSLIDNSVIIRARSNNDRHISGNINQLIRTSSDSGTNWNGSVGYGMKLPQVQTAIERYTLQSTSQTPGDDKNRILWTGPTAYTPKVNPDPYNLSIRVSRDETKDFTEARLSELTSRKLWDGVAWYSDMAVDRNKNFVGILFEAHGLQNAPAITDDTIYFTAVNRAFLEPPAGLIAWEPFTYNRDAVKDTDDGTKDGGIGWTTGWSNDVAIPHSGGMPPELIENSDLLYGNNYPFTIQGNRRLFFTSPQVTDFTLARAFNPMIDLGKTQAYYVSMLVRIESPSNGNLDLKLFSGITPGVGFGVNVARTYATNNPNPTVVFNLYTNGGNLKNQKQMDLSAGQTFMLVFKIAAAANSSTAEYVYAKAYLGRKAQTSSGGEVIPLHETIASGFGGWDVATKSVVPADMKMDRIVITTGTGAGFLIDDLRVGTTWEAVVSNQE